MATLPGHSRSHSPARLKLLIDVSTPAVDTNIGQVQFGLRYTKNGVPDTYWFQFDERDVEESREILRESQELLFEVEIVSPPANTELFVHLGKDLDTCTAEDELSIELCRDSAQRWRARRGYTDKDTPTDVERIKRFHWRAAFANATLCKGPGDPVRFPDNSPVQTKLALGYADEWYEAMYKDILRHLSEDRIEARPTSSFDLFMDSIERARILAEGSPSLELYYRLQRIMQEYESNVARVLRNPATQVRPEVSFFNVEPEQAAQFYQGRGQQVQVYEAHRVSDRQGKMVPLAFVGREPRPTLDHEANRFVVRSLKRIRRLMRKVSRSLTEFMESERAANRRFLAQEPRNTTLSPIYRSREQSIEKHAKKAQRLDEAEDRFTRYLQAFPLNQGEQATAGGSATMYYDTRYAKLRELDTLLDFTLRFVETNEASVPFEVDPFHALYERWCFIQVVEALQDIGFTFARGGEPAVVPLYHHPTPHQAVCTMYHEQLPGKELEVWYERRYPKFDYSRDRRYGLETRYKERRTTYQEVNPARRNCRPKRTPDIALEFKDLQSMDSPDIITLDPTLGFRQDKYEYRDAIRCFHKTNDRGKSLKIVRAAWGISPRRSESELSDYTIFDQNDDYRRGFIVLRPTEESLAALRTSLLSILIEVGIMDA
jgi:hypothetical protein